GLRGLAVSARPVASHADVAQALLLRSPTHRAGHGHDARSVAADFYMRRCRASFASTHSAG
ncbi:hypothetical protein ACIKTA_05850, partial [Hansschlegelia beijingensis]